MSKEEVFPGYSRISINIEDIPYLAKEENIDPDDLNRELYKNLYALRSHHYIPSIFEKAINRVTITTDDTHIDLSELKNLLQEYFNLNHYSSYGRLQNIEEKLRENNKNKNYSFQFLSNLMQKEFSTFQPSKINAKHPTQKTIHYHLNKEFMKMTIRKIEFYKDLLRNEKKYSTVNIELDKDKLNLHFAYIIMNHAEKCKESNETVKYKHAINSLVRYLNSNKHLVEEDFSVPLEYRTSGISGILISKGKRYKISKIKNYVDKNLKEIKNESQSKKVEKLNYSFFECDGTKAREILGKYYRNISSSITKEELKEILKRKMKLYDSINYIKLKVGIDSFDGYIGFQLENGYVILDKLYEDKQEGKIATNNAIYIVREEDFEKITKMSKKEAMEAIELGLIKAKRIIHSGDYEEKVKKYTE